MKEMKTHKMTILQKCFLIAGVSCLMGTGLFATAPVSWTGGAVESSWSSSSNWQSSGINVTPDVTSLVTISTPGAIVDANGVTNSSNTVTLQGDITAGLAPVLNISNSGTFYMNGGSFYVGNSAVANSGGVINITAGVVQRDTISTDNLGGYIGGSGAATNCSGTFNLGGVTGANATFNGGSGGQIKLAGGGAGETGVMNFTGYGSFSIEQLACARSGGNATINVTGGNLSLNITAGSNGLTLNDGNAASVCHLNYTIDSTGVSPFHTTQLSIGAGGGSYFTLTLGTGFSATVGQQFAIIIDSGTRTGTFTGLSEGGTISTDGYTFSASYTSTYGGGANDFVLTTTAVPEPQTFALMFAGLGMLLGGRRMRRE